MRHSPAKRVKAAWIEDHGGPDVIHIGDRPSPTRAQGEVVVRVSSATINHRDVYLRRGEAGRTKLPVILGSDGAGIIEDAGESKWAKGQRVAIYPVIACGACHECHMGAPHKCRIFAMVGGERDGTQAELVTVPEACVVPLDDKLDFDSAAAISLAGLTAWNMVVSEGAAQSGEHALVVGASGGVGVFTVLLLKKLGLTVHAVTSSSAKVDMLYKIGADSVLPAQIGPVLKSLRQLPNGGVDLAFNCVGGSTWRYVLPATRSGGRILVCGTVQSPSAELDMRQVFYRSLSIIGCSMGTPESLKEILKLAAEDPGFRATVDATIGLEGIPDAHRRMENAGIMGKIIVKMEQ